MKTLRKLLVWQSTHNPPTADDVRQGRAWFVKKDQVPEAVLVRPEDARALGVANIDGLPVEPDAWVTPGSIFFAVDP